MEEFYCIVCDNPLGLEGAESRGDGDIYDVYTCPDHGRIFEVHASYCQCGCGDHWVNEVFDPSETWRAVDEGGE